MRAAILFSCMMVMAEAHDRPIIGVLAMDTDSKNGDSYIMANYVKFIMQAGGRVVPIRGKEPESYYQEIFKHINGVLLPGGGADTIDSQYARSARIMFGLAKQANQAGDYFPMFGICLGFQTLVHIVAGGPRRHLTAGTGDVSMPLEFTNAAATSRLLKDLPTDLLQALRDEPITYNYHKFGFDPRKFNGRDSKITAFFTVLSTNKDTDGKEFVSTYEAKHFPIYGTQWHPEKHNFEWDTSKHINHSLNAIRISQYLANFFVQEARKSSHAFSNSVEEGKAMIQNFPRRFFTSNLYEVFYFDWRDLDTWEVKTWTSKVDRAGTNANVYIQLYGDQSTSDPLPLTNSDSNNFQEAKTDTFTVKTRRIGRLRKVVFWHDGSGSGSHWRLWKFTVTDRASGYQFGENPLKWLEPHDNLVCEVNKTDCVLVK